MRWGRFFACVPIPAAEDGFEHTYDVWLEKLAPHERTAQYPQYHYNHAGENNATAHMKRQLIDREVVVVNRKGQLEVGPREQIFYGEFD